MIIEVGVVPVGTAAPGVSSAAASLLASIQAQHDGLLNAQVQMILTPPTLAGSLASAVETVASLTAAITLGVPDLSFQLTTVIDQIAELAIEIAALGSIVSALGQGGMHLLVFTGEAKNLASELAAYTNSGVAGGGPDDSCAAIVMAASAGATISAMSTVFGYP